MTYRTMNSAWKKLWLNCVASRNFEGFDTEDFAFVSLDKNMSLEVNNEDVGELVEDLKNELSTELEQLQEQ